ncbi:MAG: hypothetical protein ACE5DI_02745 [Candidatus Micrarchaeia archaeon]
MKKGFVFTLDAIIAFVLAIIVLGALAEIRADESGGNNRILKLQQTSLDVLNTLDKDGTLNNLFEQTDEDATTTLETTLNELLQAKLKGRIKIDTYQYETGGTCTTCTLSGSTPTNNFCHCRSFNTPLIAKSPAASSKRVFYYSNNKPTVGIATIQVWQE